MIGGIVAVQKTGIYRIPLLAPILFRQFFLGEAAFTGRPDVGGVFHHEEKKKKKKK